MGFYLVGDSQKNHNYKTLKQAQQHITINTRIIGYFFYKTKQNGQKLEVILSMVEGSSGGGGGGGGGEWPGDEASRGPTKQ